MLTTSNILKGILTIIFIYLIFVLYVCLHIESFIFQPYEVNSTEKDIKFFKTTDNINLEFFESINKKDSVVIYFPDNNEDMYRTHYLLNNDINKSSLYALNYRGFGNSEGSPTEFYLKKDSLEFFDYIKNKYPEAKITVIGKGLGASIANYLSKQKEFKQLILIAPYDNYSKVLQVKYPFIPFLLIDNNIFNNLSNEDKTIEDTYLFYLISDNVVPNMNTMNFRLHSGNNNMIIYEINVEHNLVFFKKEFYGKLNELFK